MQDRKSARALPFDAIVVGGGPVGLASALALAQNGYEIALISGRSVDAKPMPDLGRTAALMQGSLRFLYGLGIEQELEAASWPLAAIRMIDAKQGLIRAPTIQFKAIELGLNDFGRNISNYKLTEILRARALQTSRLTLIDAQMLSARFASGSARKTEGFRDDRDRSAADGSSSQAEKMAPVEISLSNGKTLRGNLAIAADGRQSKLREVAGIATQNWNYPQTALTFHLRHARDHEDISTEFHTREGPFTLVPLADRISSVVWVVAPRHGDQLMQLSPEEFTLQAERQCQSLLGRFKLEGLRGAYPLSGLLAKQFTADNILLAGEAAHAFPPIGAQGLNLGFRDAAEIARLPLKASQEKRESALVAYDRHRRIDAASRTMAVDLLNRSLLSSFLPLDLLRSAGIAALAQLSPLRKIAMRIGMG